VLGDFLATCAHVCILFSQNGVSLSRILFTRVYGCVGVGQPSSSVVMGVEEVREADISFPDHISGPPRGCRSAVRRVAMLRAMTDGQSGLPPRWEWNASSNGQCWNLLAACASEARAVAPRAPWSLSMFVQEFVAAAQ
jgi:hypothetical protein